MPGCDHNSDECDALLALAERVDELTNEADFLRHHLHAASCKCHRLMRPRESHGKASMLASAEIGALLREFRAASEATEGGEKR